MAMGKTGRVVEPAKRAKRKQPPKKYRTKNALQPWIQPKTMYCELKYVQTCTLTPSTGSMGIHRFRANSIYDPDLTGTGHQPMFRDQMADLYNHYIVLGSTMEAVIWTEDITTHYVSVVGISQVDDAVTTLTSVIQLLEQNTTRYKLMRNSALSGEKTMVKCRSNWSCKKWFGLKDPIDDKGEYGAAMTASPTDEALFLIFANYPDMTTEVPPLKCLVTIKYFVQLSEPKEVAQS